MRICPITRFRIVRLTLASGLCVVAALMPATRVDAQDTTSDASPKTSTEGSPDVSPEIASDVASALESAAFKLRDGRPVEVLAILRRIESIEPGNPWVWYYKGAAYHAMDDWYEALSSYDRASDLLVSYGDPEPLLSESLRNARVKARRKVFGISFSAGLAFDSNVTFLGSGGAGAGLISGTRDSKFTTSLQLAYAPIANETETLTFAARFAHSWHFSITEFNYQDYGATIRYKRKLADRWAFGFQYDYDISYLGNQPFLSNHTITPSLTYAWSASQDRFSLGQSAMFYRFEARDFLFATPQDLDRDGYAHAVGLNQTFRYRPVADSDWTWDLRAAYALEYYNTEGVEFERLVHLFDVGMAVPLHSPLYPEDALIFDFSVNWEIGDYENGSLFDADRDERSDLITTYQIVLSQRVARDPDIGDVTLRGIVSWTDARSNVFGRDFSRPFTYDKWVAGFQLAWSF